mmetsp:Transcript_31762/g.61124  ORF Transcript_31762/g.61124 Transcript_31762/m.61124 type:complete len:158 (+) Transcript_31762:351-824(+)|eukprot:4575255-Pleurochrysis_carterae.AAC.4
MAAAAPVLLDPEALPAVLGEALGPGMRAISLINRSGMQLGIAGDAAAAPVLAAIAASVWQSAERAEKAGSHGVEDSVDGVDGQGRMDASVTMGADETSLGALSCLLIECEQGRLAVKGIGSFILSLSADNSVPFGTLRATADGLHTVLQPSLSQLGN